MFHLSQTENYMKMNDAKETVYKNESGKYDIIHLAMHTILNDKDPMYSTLIFSSENDSTDDRYLKTYEVYSIPLKGKNGGSEFMQLRIRVFFIQVKVY